MINATIHHLTRLNGALTDMSDYSQFLRSINSHFFGLSIRTNYPDEALKKRTILLQSLQFKKNRKGVF